MLTMRIMLIFISLVLFVNGYLASDALSTVAPKVYTVLEHDNLLVRCRVPPNPEIIVYWSKKDSTPPYQQNGNTLMVVDTLRNYTGVYICHAFNTSNPDHNQTSANVTIDVINVDVIYAAKVITMDVSPRALVEKQEFWISCDMEGNPGPDWSIRNMETGEEPLTYSGSGNVTIGMRATYMSAGYWVCTGHNRLNGPWNSTKGYNLTVFYAPRPTTTPQYRVESYTGKSVSLVMTLRAYPKPQYRWTRDDGSPIRGIQTDDDKRIQLDINDVMISDFGSYTLTMWNDYGTRTDRYQLVANGPPEAPTDVSFYDVTSDSVELRWKSGYDMGSQQHFVVMKMFNGNAFAQISDWIMDTSSNHGVNQHWTYTLTGLSSNTLYNLSIVSYNDDFMSGFSRPFMVFFTTPEPDPVPYPFEENSNLVMILGIVFGSLGLLGMMALLVYVIKWRHMRTSYQKM